MLLLVDKLDDPKKIRGQNDSTRNGFLVPPENLKLVYQG